MKLLKDRIVHDWQVEIMRTIYNASLEHLATKPLKAVTEHEQQAWWRSIEDHAVAHLYRPLDRPWRFAAFSLVQFKPGATTPLFAIAEEFRGKGYGREIIQHYLEVAKGPLIGEALISNQAIMRLNEEAGWQVMANDGRVVKLYHPGLRSRQDEINEEIVRYHAS